MKTLASQICSILLLLVLISGKTIAQKEPVDFGKVQIPDVEMKQYELDTSASAVVLCDFGKSYFQYQSEKGFQVVFERTTRIKIFKKSGYEYANVEVPYYKKSNSEKEVVTELKGYTYNLENGKMVKTKLTGESIFDEDKTENWKLKKFSLPNVKEGSVIEYTYTIKSDFLFTFREWEFQSDIPVIWSE
jgi:hypothetical protein